MVRRFLCFVAILALAGTARAAPVPYVLDQRYATIEFTTTGLVGLQGSFRKFAGGLILDFQAPGNSRVSVSVDDAAFSLSLPIAGDILRGTDYFDCQDHPQILFQSDSIIVQSPTLFTILGHITIRGVTRPMRMQAQLLSAPSAARAAGTADFYVTGTLKRSEFGMMANRDLVDDAVRIDIHARVTLQTPN